MTSRKPEIQFDQLLTEADMQLDELMNGGGDYRKVAEYFVRGYPRENLLHLLNNRNINLVYEGVHILEEIGDIAEYFVDELAELMSRNDLYLNYHGMSILSKYAKEENEFADWIQVSLIDWVVDQQRDVSSYFVTFFGCQALACLAAMRFDQLRGAKSWLVKNHIESLHIQAIDFGSIPIPG
jgi:hypothetical protein